MATAGRLLLNANKNCVQILGLSKHRKAFAKPYRPFFVATQLFSSNSIPTENETTTKKRSSGETSLVKSYLDLSKARLSALVVSTTAAGFLLAGGPLTTMGVTCAGTALCSSSAAAFNQIFEISRDSQMKRTQKRPLVQGDISPMHASLVATTWGVAGTSILALGTDPYTTALGAGNIVLYAGLYTYMKPRSVLNTWVGAVVGAIPPVIGWSAATGGEILNIECLLLGATLYLWQMPHFFALSYMHRIDYARGGFKMVPVLEEDGEKTANLVVRYAWYLSTIPFISTAAGVTSTMFGLEGLLLNAYALYIAHDFKRNRTNAKARKVFLASLGYLPCFLMLFLIHSKTWDEKASEDNIIRKEIDSFLRWIRNEGRQLCIHENYHSDSAECPVIATTKETQKVVAAGNKVSSVAPSSN